MELRHYQKIATNLAINHIADTLAGGSTRLLLAGPCGTGKSYVEIAILNRFPQLIMICPKEEIIEGLISKGGDANRIFTPMKLLNRLREGFHFKVKPEAILFDEVHHWEAATWQELELYIDCDKYIGLTASPYRGTVKETNHFIEEWGKPVWMIGYKEAFDQGLIHLPEMEIVPLVNDDYIEVRNGEFVVSDIDQGYQSKLTETLALCQKAYNKPTIISVSTQNFARFLSDQLGEASVILADTPEKERYKAIEQCLKGNIPIIQIQTIGEGIDYPFQQIIDLSPIYSPVKWIQLLGRIFRVPGNYICTNRNLIRHAYLLQGCIPESIVKTDQQLFGNYNRSANRILGLESLGRFKPSELEMTNGLKINGYFLEALVEGQIVKFSALYHPLHDTGIYAYKIDEPQIDGSIKPGKWRQIAQLPEDLKGFSSVPSGDVTEKQYNWWKRQAKWVGLNPEQPINKKNFQVLPVLVNLGVRLK